MGRWQTACRNRNSQRRWNILPVQFGRNKNVQDGWHDCNTTVTNYTLEGDKVVHETNGTDELWYYYDESGNLVSFELNGTSYYYVKNLQGDIIAITDDSGTKVVEYVYNSWGKLISTTGTLAETVGVKNPYRYRGYRYDTETCLYYLQSRYYDPEIRRFINADSYVDTGDTVLSTNMFAYCENSPIICFDFDGMAKSYIKSTPSNMHITAEVLTIVFGITGVLFGAAGYIIDKYASNRTAIVTLAFSYKVKKLNIGRRNTKKVIVLYNITRTVKIR